MSSLSNMLPKTASAAKTETEGLQARKRNRLLALFITLWPAATVTAVYWGYMPRMNVWEILLLHFLPPLIAAWRLAAGVRVKVLVSIGVVLVMPVALVIFSGYAGWIYIFMALFGLEVVGRGTKSERRA